MMDFSTNFSALIAGGAAAAAIKLAESVIVARVHIRAQAQEERMNRTEKQVKDILASSQTSNYAMRVLLRDRIKHLSRSYITAGVIAYDDRRDIFKMHGVYHNELGGNGDLDSLMQQVERLPIK